MKPENKAFLEEHRSIWDTLRKAQYLRFPHQGIKDGLVRIMREEFRPGYTADLWCTHCVATMVREVYTEFEKWETAQVKEPVIVSDPNPEPMPEGYAEVIEFKESGEVTKTVEPFTPPIPVKANFPSHKKHHRR